MDSVSCSLVCPPKATNSSAISPSLIVMPPPSRHLSVHGNLPAPAKSIPNNASKEGLRKPRAKHACRECNARRIRCNVTERHPCANCCSSNAACEVVPSRRGRYPRRSRLQQQQQQHHDDQDQKQLHHAPPFPSIESSKSAMPFGRSDLIMPVSPEQPAPVIVHTSPSSMSSDPDRRTTNGADRRPSRAASADLTSPASTGNLFFGESNFLTLVPGPHEDDKGPNSTRKSRLSFAISSAAGPTASQHSPSPPQMSVTSASQDRYLQEEGALRFPDYHSCLPTLRAYFEWFHPCFPILDRPDIARQIETQEVSQLLLHAMLFIGAIYCTDHDILVMGFKDRSEAKMAFYTRMRLLFHADREKNPSALIPSLFLASFWRGGPSDIRDVRYWLGNVITLAESHGLHRSSRFTTRNPHVASMRRRIWWSIYVRERQSAASLGLPSRIRDEDCDIEELSPSDFVQDDDLSQSTQFGTCQPDHITYVMKMVEIAGLLGKVIDLNFLPRRAPATPEKLLDLSMQLENWRLTLPLEMREMPENAPVTIWTSLLHLGYNHLRILIHRDGFLADRLEDGDTDAALSAANRITRIVEDMLSQRSLQFGQMHLITSLFAALCIHTINMTKSRDVNRKIAEHRAQMCLLGLKEIQKYWRINNNVLDLFLEYLDESIARRIHGSASEELKLELKTTSEHSPAESHGPLSPPYISSAHAYIPTAPPMSNTLDVFEDQYVSFVHAWQGHPPGDLGMYLDPQLYSHGPHIQGGSLAFLERSL